MLGTTLLAAAASCLFCTGGYYTQPDPYYAECMQRWLPIASATAAPQIRLECRWVSGDEAYFVNKKKVSFEDLPEKVDYRSLSGWSGFTKKEVGLFAKSIENDLQPLTWDMMDYVYTTRFISVAGVDYWKGKPVTFGGLGYQR